MSPLDKYSEALSPEDLGLLRYQSEKRSLQNNQPEPETGSCELREHTAGTFPGSAGASGGLDTI